MASKKLQTRDVRMSITIIVSVIVTSLLAGFIFTNIGSNIKQQTQTNLVSATTGQMNSIKGYLEEIDVTLDIASYSTEIKNLLADPNNADYKKQAQAKLDELAGGISDIEGLSVHTWDTACIARNDAAAHPEYIGPSTKKENAKALQSAIMNSPKNLCNTGIVKAETGNEYVYTAYKALFNEENDPIGYVSISVYAESIMNQMSAISMPYVNNWNTYLINTDSQKVLAAKCGDDTNDEFNNTGSVGSVFQNESLDKICKELKPTGEPQATLTVYEGRTSGITAIGSCKTAVVFETKTSELYTTNNRIKFFSIIFYIVMAIIFAAVTIITRRQEAQRVNLNRQQMQNEKMRTTLNEAVFKDILTGAKNRAAFSIESEKTRIRENETIMFGMISINGLADINAAYGNDTGDMVISEVAEACTNLGAADVYRTGSGEFMIVQRYENTQENIENFMNAITALKTQLNNTSHNTPAGPISFPCSAVVAKKSRDINASVVTIMKTTIRTQGAVPANAPVQYIDMDRM